MHRRPQASRERPVNDNKPDKPVWLMRDQATMATIQGLRRQGITTAADIARALNDQGIATPKRLTEK